MASPFSRHVRRPDPSGQPQMPEAKDSMPARPTDTAWHLGDWLRARFEGARSMMPWAMPAGMSGDSSMMSREGMPAHDVHAEAMRRIMGMYEDRVHAAEAQLDADEAHAVTVRLGALVDVLVSSIQDTPDHLLAKMLDHSMMQDYERRFDEVMRLPHPSDGDHH